MTKNCYVLLLLLALVSFQCSKPDNVETLPPPVLNVPESSEDNPLYILDLGITVKSTKDHFINIASLSYIDADGKKVSVIASDKEIKSYTWSKKIKTRTPDKVILTMSLGIKKGEAWSLDRLRKVSYSDTGVIYKNSSGWSESTPAKDTIITLSY